jgi:hypothetical protein
MLHNGTPYLLRHRSGSRLNFLAVAKVFNGRFKERFSSGDAGNNNPGSQALMLFIANKDSTVRKPGNQHELERIIATGFVPKR